MPTDPSATSPAPTDRALARIAGLVLLPFAAFSVWVLAQAGVGGLIASIRRDPWALQLLVDLVIACTLGITWMVRDARTRGIRAAPFVALTLAAGSIGLLSYLVRRGVTPRRGT